MNDTTKIVLIDGGSPVALGDKENRFTYNLLPVGQFYDKRYGKININHEKIKKLAENFGKFPSYEVPVKLGHSDGARSPGKVIAAEAKDNGLEVTMLVDDETAKAINDKQYRYMSAEFKENYQDKETGADVGAVLLGAALVNQPANPYMQPLMLADDIDPEGEQINMSEVEDLQIQLSDVKTQLHMARQESETKSKEAEATSKKITELEAEIKALREERERAEKAKNEAEVKAFCDKWEAKIPPAVIEAVKPLLLSDSSKIIKLGDNEDITSLKFFDELFAKFPEFATKQFSDTDTQTVELSDIDKARERAKAIAGTLK